MMKTLRLAKKRNRIFIAVLLFFLIVAGYFSYNFFFAREDIIEDEVVLVEELPEETSTDSQQEVEPDQPVLLEMLRVVEEGDSFSKILLEWLSNDEVYALVSKCKEVYPPSKIKVGQEYHVTTYNGVLTSFSYLVDNQSKLTIVREDESDVFKVALEKIIYDVQLKIVRGEITHSMFMTMSDIGENAVLAVKLAEIFAWEINFINAVQPGDSFNLLVEKLYQGDEFKGYGKLLAAEFINQGQKYEAFFFEDKQGFVEYYTSKGESVKRAFLKAPLSYSRISSGYTNKRLHPIYKTWKAHPAIDYAAPSGTPVKAIGNGVVTFVGSDKHAGKYVKIKHHNGYESMYLHLSKFASGLKKGLKVKQGQLIAYVGSTGDSTGPHLDFRMKQNGQFINPTKHTAPRAEPIKGKELETFKKMREEYRTFLDNSKDLTAYIPKEEEK